MHHLAVGVVGSGRRLGRAAETGRCWAKLRERSMTAIMTTARLLCYSAAISSGEVLDPDKRADIEEPLLLTQRVARGLAVAHALGNVWQRRATRTFHGVVHLGCDSRSAIRKTCRGVLP